VQAVAVDLAPEALVEAPRGVGDRSGRSAQLRGTAN